ncbi:uncharacterized protein K460DRAFT_138168 [Cucurbitaria berberidis CBS 394.84]|uniref:Uncharacterized protein n=1 Tax=Cucurbitaria berberidis CBS 394.84 TaxID=1168544 RepID=A0A9P4GCI0_9PLEO|nr:uncharacterized protein K460DRAFT_138168 [Cucurbitaria berberidis CBS 394.84]KAF1843016.1 hypothetical protein K460DRAFT_138168 [Cucurbitaria berberidis CBS 394.84]
MLNFPAAAFHIVRSERSLKRLFTIWSFGDSCAALALSPPFTNVSRPNFISERERVFGFRNAVEAGVRGKLQTRHGWRNMSTAGLLSCSN